MKRPRAGLALMVVVGILGVLTLLATAFVTLARLERRASQQRLNASRALLLARSGLEDAMARLGAGQDPLAAGSDYRGQDWDADGILGSFEAQQGPPASSFDACPVSQALRPSFHARTSAANLDPALLGVEGRRRGYSGLLQGGTYALKVTAPGGFYVNGGDPSVVSNPALTSDVNTNLRRMLGVLAEALDREDGVNDGKPVDQLDGERLVSLRPATSRGWKDWDQVRILALGGSQAKLDALKPYLTLQAWVDKKVIQPNVSDGMVSAGPGGWVHILLARPLASSGRAPDFARIPATPAGKIVGRAPVDLAWARRRRPALLALLANLKGLYLDETNAQYSGSGAWIGAIGFAELALDWAQPTDDCRTVADQILAFPGEISTWGQWNDFCDGLSVSDASTWLPWSNPPDYDCPYGYDPANPVQTSDLKQAKRDLLKANFNPNTDLNKFNPDASRFKLVDKSDLLVHSTEFNLVPRGGSRLACVGRVCDARDRLLASRTLCVELAQDRLLRMTTQSEFVAGNLGSLDVAGDESAFRGYAFSPADPFITPSGGLGKTFGHRLFQDPGVSLQTYPEPHPVWTSPATGTPAVYDGQIALASVETSDGEYGPGMMFLAGWARDYRGDFSGGGGVLDNQVTTGGIAPPPPETPVWGASRWGMLRPDGVYEEDGTNRVLAYQALGNAAASRGTASFWWKPGYEVAKVTQCMGHGHQLFSNSLTYPPPGAFNPTARMVFFSLIGAFREPSYYDSSGADQLAFFWENGFWAGDDLHEQYKTTPSDDQGQRLAGRRWKLLTLNWDMNQADEALGSHIYIDRGLLASEQNEAARYPRSPQIEGPAVDFRYADGQGGASNVFYLGPEPRHVNSWGWQAFSGGGGTWDNWNNPVDATLDEFALYDLGESAGKPGDGLERTQKMLHARFEAGRFYKESAYGAYHDATEVLDTPLGPDRNAGEWFSAPIDLGGARIRTLAWTQIVPRDLRAPAVKRGKPEDGDDGPDGRVVLELAHAGVQVPAAAGKDYAPDAGGNPIRTLFTRSGGQAVGRQVNGPFRLHAVFQPNLSDPARTAILDPLALDDVTVAYQPAGGAPISAWGEGE